MSEVAGDRHHEYGEIGRNEGLPRIENETLESIVTGAASRTTVWETQERQQNFLVQQPDSSAPSKLLLLRFGLVTVCWVYNGRLDWLLLCVGWGARVIAAVEAVIVVVAGWERRKQLQRLDELIALSACLRAMMMEVLTPQEGLQKIQVAIVIRREDDLYICSF